jgi:cysteine desulfurase/selenocysteine lyase
MRIQQLLSNEARRRAEFPVTERMVFLAHSQDCPLPRRVAASIAEYVGQAATAGQQALVFPKLLVEGRQLGGQLLHCLPEEVAFVGPTSLALSYFASGLKFRKGDNVLIYYDDYPSNVYPWTALAEQGVQVRLLNTRGLGVIRPKDVLGQVDERTRLVALSSCHYISGYRIDHTAIGRELRARGILFCLDGIQTLGAFPTTVDYVDMMAADAHKWLLGPSGAGLMYVRKELQAHLTPPVYGWHNIRCPNFVAQEEIAYRSGAKKYEVGSHNLVGLVGLIAGLRLLLEYGIEAIAAELLRKRSWLIPELQARGHTVLGADDLPENASAIIAITEGPISLVALHEKLVRHRILTTLREDRNGERYLRIAPHFYNTDNELRLLLDLM